MKYVKYVGFSLFFVVIIGLLIGGFFLVKNTGNEVFIYKEVSELTYGKIDINDFVEQQIDCNTKTCEFKRKKLNYTISEIDSLGPQEVLLTINYDSKEYVKTFNVNIVDKENPVITLTESAIILKVNDKFEAKEHIKEVSDNFDSLNIENITIDNPVDTKKVGEYEVTYSIADSSNNTGEAKLKVIVKEKNNITSSTTTANKTTTSNSVPKTSTPPKVEEEIKIEYKPTNPTTNTPPTSEEQIKEEFTWKLNISGAGTLNKNFTTNQTSSNDIISYEADFNAKLDFKYTLTGSGKYQIFAEVIYEDESIYKESEDIETNELDFDLPIPLGKFIIILKVKDTINNKEYSEELTVDAKNPTSLKDIALEHENKGTYEAIALLIIGGNTNNMSMEYGITNSDDPRVLDEDADIEDILEYSGGNFKLKYQAGYTYEIAVAVTENDKTVTKVITIKK